MTFCPAPIDPTDNDYYPRIRTRKEIDEMRKALEEDNPMKWAIPFYNNKTKNIRDKYLYMWIGQTQMLRWFTDRSVENSMMLNSEGGQRVIHNALANNKRFKDNGR